MIGKTGGKPMLKFFWRLTPHILTLLVAIGYLILGGYLLCTIEGWAPPKPLNASTENEILTAKEKLEKLAVAAIGDQTLREAYRVELDSFLKKYYDQKYITNGWTLLDGFLYAYSAVTTIGYSHLATKTDLGRIFYVFYNVIGIPLCTLVLADWGLLLEEGLSALCRWILSSLAVKVSLFRKWSTRKPLLVPAESLFFLPIVLIIFLLYIALGGLLLPLWETDWSYIEGFYVAFDGVTTIGIGDIYPRNNDYFLATLLYLSIGIAIASTAIGGIADYLRVLHHAGTKPGDCGLRVVWFGGKHMRVEQLTQALGKEFGATEFEIRAVQERLDVIVNRALKGGRGEDDSVDVGRRRAKRVRRSPSKDRWHDSVIIPLTLVPAQNAAPINSAHGGGVFYGGDHNAHLTDTSDDDRQRGVSYRRS